MKTILLETARKVIKESLINERNERISHYVEMLKTKTLKEVMSLIEEAVGGDQLYKLIEMWTAHIVDLITNPRADVNDRKMANQLRLHLKFNPKSQSDIYDKLLAFHESNPDQAEQVAKQMGINLQHQSIQRPVSTSGPKPGMMQRAKNWWASKPD